MSFFEWVKESAESVADVAENSYGKLTDGFDDAKEYFVGDDEAASGEVDALPGSNASTTVNQEIGSKPVNWAAAGVIVGALSLAAKFVK